MEEERSITTYHSPPGLPHDAGRLFFLSLQVHDLSISFMIMSGSGGGGWGGGGVGGRSLAHMSAACLWEGKQEQ